MPEICPLKSGDSRDVLAHERVHALRRVHEVTGDLRARSIAPLENENGTGGSSPRSSANREKSMLRLCSRGGVPVFKPAPCEAERLAATRRGRATAARRRARRPLIAADVHQAVEERPGRDDQRVAAIDVAVLHREPGDAAVLDENAARLADDP